MEAEVALVEGLEVAAVDGGTHVGDNLIEVREVRLADGDEACGEGFEGDAYFKIVGHVIGGDMRDAGAAAVAAFDEAFGLQNVQRSADAGLGDAETNCPFPFDDRFAGSEGAVENFVAHPGGDGIFDEVTATEGDGEGGVKNHDQTTPS